MYNKCTARDAGTLNYFKVFLRRKNVNGNVKSNYASHEQLFELIGEALIVEQAMEFFDMDSHDSTPVCIPQNISNLTRAERARIGDNLLQQVLRHYGYAMFCVDKHYHTQLNPPPNQSKYKVRTVLGRTPDGHIVVCEKEVPTAKDQMHAYSMNLCYWAMHLMHLNDMAKEGDVDRLVISAKHNIPFFYSHSTKSKYFVENLDFLLKSTIISSAQTSLRLL